ncbi:hypothetical protein GTU79_04535 [Sodalis ligni]|nr:hypothetical protein GTU79_04535 [Sodalis ligni]
MFKAYPFISDKIPIYESDGNCIGIIWLIIHGYTRKEISYILNISSCAVKCRLYSVFQKINFNIKQLRELYINNRMDSYIPSSILKMVYFFMNNFEKYIIGRVPPECRLSFWVSRWFMQGC